MGSSRRESLPAGGRQHSGERMAEDGERAEVFDRVGPYRFLAFASLSRTDSRSERSRCPITATTFTRIESLAFTASLNYEWLMTISREAFVVLTAAMELPRS